MKKVIIGLLLILLIILSVCLNVVYADEVIKFNASNSEGYIGVIESNLKSEYCEKMIECYKSHFVETNMIGYVEIKGSYLEYDGENIISKAYSENIPLVNVNSDFLNLPTNSEKFTISFSVNGQKYEVTTSTLNTYVNNEIVSKDSIEGYKEDYLMATKCNELIDIISSASLEGLIGGSIGAGYNVAIPYSKTQRPLTDILELKSGSKGYYYDFITTSDIDFTFSYYISPLFGEIYANDLPKTKDGWVKYADQVSFVNGSNLMINKDYLAFKEQLVSDGVSENGMRISDDIKVEGGAKRFNMTGCENPKSVLSYNMPMYTPYIFSVTNGRGKLLMNALNKIEGYTYCLYDNNIYGYVELEDGSKEFKPITSMASTGTSHNNLYLYNQVIETLSQQEDGTNKLVKSKSGVIIIGIFDECVVDTTKGERKIVGDISNMEEITFDNLYLTGRKVGFDNSYSDSLDFNSLNKNVVYTTYDSGNKEAYNPKNIAFPVPSAELKNLNLYDVWSGEAALLASDELNEKIKSVIKAPLEEEILGYLFNINNHGEIPSTCEAIRFYTGFAGFYGGEDKIEGSNDDAVKYTFYIARNNNYINDSSLLSWLKTDTARSISYVKAQELIAKITGDYTANLEDLSYEASLAMKEIENEIKWNKKTYLSGGLNVLTIVLGVLLLIFSLLLPLFYWIDIFNTFTEFSFLRVISFGGLYPVTDKDSVASISQQIGADRIKFVTFGELLIITFLLMIIGILFINGNLVIGFIVRMFYYLTDLLGMV